MAGNDFGRDKIVGRTLTRDMMQDKKAREWKEGKGFTPQSTIVPSGQISHPGTGMANPASVWSHNMGYSSRIVNTPQGQSAMVTINGKEVEEWAAYRQYMAANPQSRDRIHTKQEMVNKGIKIPIGPLRSAQEMQPASRSIGAFGSNLRQGFVEQRPSFSGFLQRRTNDTTQQKSSSMIRK